MTTHQHKLQKARRIETAITSLMRMGLVYNLGGARFNGRITAPQHNGEAWTDCSGCGLYVKQVANIPSANGAGNTVSMAEEGKEGYSDYLTFFIKNPPGEVDNEHVIIRLRKRPRPWHRGVPKYRWAECGGSDNPKSGGGPTWFKPTAERIAEFPIRRCFEGF